MGKFGFTRIQSSHDVMNFKKMESALVGCLSNEKDQRKSGLKLHPSRREGILTNLLPKNGSVPCSPSKLRMCSGMIIDI